MKCVSSVILTKSEPGVLSRVTPSRSPVICRVSCEMMTLTSLMSVCRLICISTLQWQRLNPANMWCEKPLVNSLAQADALIAAAQMANRTVTPVFQYRFGLAMDQLQALKSAGLTGKPFMASLETHWNRNADYYAIPWRGHGLEKGVAPCWDTPFTIMTC